MKLPQPGISVLKAEAPQRAAQQMRDAFPKAKMLHEAARIVGSTSEDLIRSVGFDLMFVPSTELPNHYRITHPNGAAGFSDENLERLALVFDNMSEG